MAWPVVCMILGLLTNNSDNFCKHFALLIFRIINIIMFCIKFCIILEVSSNMTFYTFIAVEFDTSDAANPKCKLYPREGEEPFCSEEYATKVLQKCLSIPITMRAILKKTVGWLETRKQKEVSCLQDNRMMLKFVIGKYCSDTEISSHKVKIVGCQLLACNCQRQ